MTFDFPHHVKLSQTPTPIERLERLSRILEGPDILVKREDLTDTAMSGNKVRKLEFLLADAQQKKCDFIITCGGYQSNHARTTAVAAARLGLKCHLILRNGMGSPLEGNLFLDRLVGAETQFVNEQAYQEIDKLMAAAAEEAKERGKKPYIISEGGSDEIGALGYVKAAQELAEQLKTSKIKVDHIILAVGSGGTYAGLLVGKHLYDISANIYGINVCDDEAYFVNKIHRIVKSMQKKIGVDLKIGKRDINIIDGYVGKGYGLSRQEEIDIIKMAAKSEGLILDPVYTGKAMYGLVDQIRQGRFKEGETVLFLHTGGLFGIFAKKSLFF